MEEATDQSYMIEVVVADLDDNGEPFEQAYEVTIPFASSDEMAQDKAKFAVAHTYHRETDLENFTTTTINKETTSAEMPKM